MSDFGDGSRQREIRRGSRSVFVEEDAHLEGFVYTSQVHNWGSNLYSNWLKKETRGDWLKLWDIRVGTGSKECSVALAACLASSGFACAPVSDKLCLSRSHFPGDLFTVSPSHLRATPPLLGIDFHSAVLNFAIRVGLVANPLLWQEAAFCLGWKAPRAVWCGIPAGIGRDLALMSWQELRRHGASEQQDHKPKEQPALLWYLPLPCLSFLITLLLCCMTLSPAGQGERWLMETANRTWNVWIMNVSNVIPA